eukprot:4475908-Prymnesium_polylepis.1
MASLDDLASVTSSQPFLVGGGIRAQPLLKSCGRRGEGGAAERARKRKGQTWKRRRKESGHGTTRAPSACHVPSTRNTHTRVPRPRATSRRPVTHTHACPVRVPRPVDP